MNPEPFASVMSPLVAMSPVMSPFESTPIESLPTIPASRKGWLPAADVAVTCTRRVAPSEVACETISRLSGPVVGRTQESKATPLTVPALWHQPLCRTSPVAQAPRVPAAL